MLSVELETLLPFDEIIKRLLRYSGNFIITKIDVKETMTDICIYVLWYHIKNITLSGGEVIYLHLITVIRKRSRELNLIYWVGLPFFL
jgi:hypothetical protein